MSQSLPQVSTWFSIDGENLDPDQVTLTLGLKPTDFGLKGTKRREASIGALRVSFWSYGFEKEHLDDIDGGISRLLDVLWPKRESIIKFLNSSDCTASFGTTVTIFDERPTCCLSPVTLSRLAYFGLEYCLEIYDYS